MSKYIKLEDSIEAVYQGRRKPVDDEWVRILEALNAVPSADVIPHKRGHWKREEGDDYNYYCSECGRVMHYASNWCHCCGADMRGEE